MNGGYRRYKDKYFCRVARQAARRTTHFATSGSCAPLLSPRAWKLRPRAFESLKGKPQLDTVADLMPLDVGGIYRKIEASDKDRRLYGLIPLMASSSYGQIGALNAESFCERVLRCAGHIVTDGNTLLGDTKIEKLTILRMNRAFMVHMRKHYSHAVMDALARQFGMSIVENA